MKLIEIKTYSDPMMAHVDLAKLNDNGIEAMIDHEEDFVLVDPSILTGRKIQLKVRQEDADTALAVLEL